MRISRAGEGAFVGRAKQLSAARVCIESGLNVWLKGESGVGKTALAKRAAPGAFYVAHCSPTKEMLVSLLVELYGEGLYLLDEDDEDEEESEDDLRRKLKRMDAREATKAICDALEKSDKETGLRPVVIFDEFDSATATSVRAVREIASVATVICCAESAKVAQKPFLFSCTKIEVPRLTKSENEKLVGRLLDDYGDAIESRERPRLLRQIVEQSQGLPSIARELVKRAAARGDLSLRAVRREELHGAKPLDMTPGLLILGICLFGWRVAMRPLHDVDMTVLFGFSGAALMIVRLFAFRVASRNPRR